ncbi:SDR family NAD(P)-dependent oxidoreductase [Leucobacter sp. Z1108]|uniref:SDR family NAD(P)-dependent oxidoreductase n=1 Tax=Leucobacter sp. Z1108 TaxID=3439066 RepID=UPI003F37F01B
MSVGVVTGGASGIGAACVRRLVKAGHSVVVADRSFAAAQQVAERCGERAFAVEVDVTQEASCRKMTDAVVDRFGKLDFAVNSAGVGNLDSSRLIEIPFEEWRRVLSVNLDGLFLSMAAEIRIMAPEAGGSIVNIASVMSAVAVAGAAAYVASKHGVIGLTKAAALDYAAQGIRVNAVGPGYVETAMLNGRLALAPADAREEIIGRHPMGRIAAPEEIADAVVYLVGDGASFITGAYLPVDGGYIVR